MVDALLATHPGALSYTEYPEGSEGDCDVEISCTLWNIFVQRDLQKELNNRNRQVAKISFISTAATTGDLSQHAQVCEGSIVRVMLDSLIQSSKSQGNHHYEAYLCNGNTWKVGACGADFPSICVNCANPCTGVGSEDTLNCVHTSNMKVVVIDFIDEPIQFIAYHLVILVCAAVFVTLYCLLARWYRLRLGGGAVHAVLPFAEDIQVAP